MNKRTKLTWFKFWGLRSLKNIKSLSLVELMISIMIVGTMFLSLFSLETFSFKQVLGADRRTKVQNNLAYCLEHMSKYVQQANGNDNNNPPIKLYPNSGPPWSGFQVRYDCNARQTPSSLTDDVWIYYTLPSGSNNLSVGCKTDAGADCAGGCSKFFAGEELLSNKIVAGFSNTIPTDISRDPTVATSGFFVVVDALGNFVDVGLVGRYYPARLPTRLTRLTENPQVGVKTRLICNNSSSN